MKQKSTNNGRRKWFALCRKSDHWKHKSDCTNLALTKLKAEINCKKIENTL